AAARSLPRLRPRRAQPAGRPVAWPVQASLCRAPAGRAGMPPDAEGQLQALAGRPARSLAANARHLTAVNAARGAASAPRAIVVRVPSNEAGAGPDER